MNHKKLKNQTFSQDYLKKYLSGEPWLLACFLGLCLGSNLRVRVICKVRSHTSALILGLNLSLAP